MIRGSIILALLVALIPAGWLLHQNGIEMGRSEVRHQWHLQQEADAKATLVASLQARSRELAWQAQADKLRQETTREIADLNRRHAAALDSLRHRASRPADYLPGTAEIAGPGPAAGCGADRLYREDAAAALGIARDADIVRLSLMQCRNAYQAAAGE